jgi:hypothetical protein
MHVGLQGNMDVGCALKALLLVQVLNKKAVNIDTGRNT